MMLNGKKINTGRIFDTIADVGSLLVSAVYFTFIILMLSFGLGTKWLNWAMFALTILYLTFFITKIAALNRLFERNNAERLVRYILRYSKWSMKLINALFVVMSVVSTKDVEGSVLLMVGVLMVIMTFVISVLWDIAAIILKKKLKVLWHGWGELSQEEKNARVSSIIDTLMSGIDTVSGVDIIKLSKRKQRALARDEAEGH